jgi:molybdopterin/thiamine biosynthesis adenylyltransferase
VNQTLQARSALVLGLGGLGSPAALLLASAGVGRLLLVDDGAVEPSDLSRQPLFGEADLGQRKAAAAARRLAELLPAPALEPFDRRLDAAGAPALLGPADVVAECSCRFEAMFVANDAAVAAGKPLVHGAARSLTAHLLSVVPGRTGCLRCLFEAPPPPGQVPSCAQAGIVGALSGFAGGLMGAEALRLLSGERGAYAGRLFVFEARSGRGRLVLVRRRPGCPACAGTQPLEPAGTTAGTAAAEAWP